MDIDGDNEELVRIRYLKGKMTKERERKILKVSKLLSGLIPFQFQSFTFFLLVLFHQLL